MTTLLLSVCALVTIDLCRRLLAEQDGFIMACCRKLAGTSRRSAPEVEDAACELYNRVMEHLLSNDCERLRSLRDGGGITAFLKVVISRVHIDAIVRREGKDQRRSRAVERFGEVGGMVYDLACTEQRPAEEVRQIMAFRGYRHLTPEEVTGLIAGVSEFGRYTPSDPDLTVGLHIADDDDDPPEPVRIAGREAEPEHRLGEAQAGAIRERVVAQLLSLLTGGERMILLMKHPLDDETPPLTFTEIARRLGKSAKQVEHQYYGVMKRVRELIMASPIALDDILTR